MAPDAHLRARLGKATGIVEDDLRAFLATRPSEDASLEAKDLKKGRLKDQLESMLLEPIVAFLNKPSGDGGLLILGAMTEGDRVVDLAGSPKRQVSPAQLRSWILEYVRSLPDGRPPLFTIVMVEIANQEEVFLVEVVPADRTITYYSAKSAVFFMRQADESKKMSVLEGLRLAEGRRQARVEVAPLEPLKLEGAETAGNPTSYRLPLRWLNTGNSPARQVMTTIQVFCVEGTLHEVRSTRSTLRTLQPVGLNAYGHFQRTMADDEVLYPGKDLQLGVLTVVAPYNQEFVLQIAIESMEERARATQRFEISQKVRASTARPLGSTLVEPFL